MQRFEWKYRVPEELAGELSAALAARTRPDAYCLGPGGTYGVRSVYYDTPDLRFYHEKKDGLKVRRKLRVRNYGNGHYFLEIKRKLDKLVVKERVSVSGSQFAPALDGVDAEVLLAGRAESDVRVLERFRDNLKTLGLVPMLLIAYERRALVGLAEPDLRITLDHDLRARPRPCPDDLFEEGRLLEFGPRHLLELKFAGRPPRWLMNLVATLRLKRESYSKYCEGIDHCTNDAHADRASGTNATTGP